MRWRRLLLFLPFILGFGLAALLNYTEAANPTFRILISLSAVLALAGLFASAILLLIYLTHFRAEKRRVRQAEHLQRHFSEDRRRFLRRLDHELKNPLTAMRAGLANFANAPDPATRRAALATVETQTMRLSRLTADLRKIAELENRPLERAPVNLDQLLNEAVELAREKPEAQSRQIKLILPQAPWPLPTIFGDWDLIFLAIYNLLDNALKFSDDGDTVEVRGREIGKSIAVEVADTGPGISISELPHVWEELYRGESGRTVPGSGLGLALVRAVIELHDGSVYIDSKIQQGTIVTVLLPVNAPKEPLAGH